MSAHPGTEKGYALNFLSPVRYVAASLERAPALSSELVAGYEHSIAGDLARVRQHEGLASDTEARAFLVERALLALGDQVEQNGDGKWRLTKPFDDLRYERKKLHRIVDHHAALRDPFDPMSGRFSENIRRKGRDTMNELRESMREFGWVSEFPALVDERGVVLVGHRRLAVAGELGIEPVIKKLRIGSGDVADAERFKLALVSNVGFKEMTPEERKDIAEYLYGEREWSQARIAEALSVDQATISRDLGELCSVHNSPRRGRPRKLSPAQQDEAIRRVLDEGEPMSSVQHDLIGTKGHTVVSLVIAKERGRREALTLPAEPTPEFSDEGHDHPEVEAPEIEVAPEHEHELMTVCRTCGAVITNE